MRITIDLPDHLHRAAKIRAIEEGISLNELLNRCVEEALRKPANTQRRRDSEPATKKHALAAP